jgi:four helix bundle protein
MQDFGSLQVWGKGHQLTLAVYKATAAFPNEELYGLTSQIRRACASIPANIAEGWGRSGKTELGRFLQVFMGSASELEYHLLLAHDLGFLGETKLPIAARPSRGIKAHAEFADCELEEGLVGVSVFLAASAGLLATRTAY